MKFIGNLLREGYRSFESWRSYSNIRKKAHRIRKKIVDRRGNSFLNPKLLKQIKEYANSEFGSPAYWPWLACYTEICGEFKEGWVPDEYYRLELIPRLNPRPIALLSTVKSFDHHLFEGFSLEPFLVRVSNSFFDKNMNFVNNRDAYRRLTSVGTEMIVKIDGGPSGKGHVFMHPDDIDFSVFEDISDCVIQPVVSQHDNLNKLYSRSINTLRIFTLFSEDGTVEEKYTYLRFGKGGSRIDNLRVGGFFMFIDKDGRVASPTYDTYCMDAGKNHPDTGFEYSALTVPGVLKAVEQCKKSHLQFPYTKLIAWDVYIDQNGTPGLIEWNANSPDTGYMEALRGPLYLDK